MSQNFKCNCNSCGHDFDLSQGGGMANIVYFCSDCGKTKNQPRKAPRPDRSGYMFPANLNQHFDYLKEKYEGRAVAQLDGSLVIREIPTDQIQRFTTEYLTTLLSQPKTWPRSGDRWDEEERQQMLEISGQCECGGTWQYPESPSYKPHDLHRCPKCRSKNYRYTAMLDTACD